MYLVALGLSCGRWAPYLRLAGSLVVACKLLVVACMWDLVPGSGAWSLNHCATREVPKCLFFELRVGNPFLCL